MKMRRCSLFCKRRSRDCDTEEHTDKLEGLLINPLKGLEGKENVNMCDSISNNTIPTGTTWSLSNDSSTKPELSLLIQSMLWDEVSKILVKFPREVLRYQPLSLLGDSGENSYSLPLHLACACRAPVSIITHMIQIYPEGLSATDKRWGKLPLHFACIKCGGVETIQTLLDFFSDAAKVSDYEGCFPIHYACIYGTVEEVDILFKAYPEAIRKKDKMGRSPYDLAKASGNSDKSRIVHFLKKQKNLMYRMKKPVKNISTNSNYDEEISLISFDDDLSDRPGPPNNAELMVDSKMKSDTENGHGIKQVSLNTGHLSLEQRFVFVESDTEQNRNRIHGNSNKTLGFEKHTQDPTDIPDNISVHDNSDELSHVSLDCYFQKNGDHVGQSDVQCEGVNVKPEQQENCLDQECSKTLTANFLTELLQSEDGCDDCKIVDNKKLLSTSSPSDSNTFSCAFEQASFHFTRSGNHEETLRDCAQFQSLVTNLKQKRAALSKRKKHVDKYDKKLKEIEKNRDVNSPYTKSKKVALEEAKERVNHLFEEKKRLNSKIDREKALLRDIEQDVFLTTRDEKRKKEKNSLFAKKKYNEEKYKEISKDVEDLCEQLTSVMKKKMIFSEQSDSVESILDECA